MMKSTKHQLKAKHFHYLTGSERKKPLSVLVNLYGRETDFRFFFTEVDFLLLSGLDGRLRRDGFEYHYIGLRLQRQIEVAYILYVDMGIQYKVSYCPHSKSIEQMYATLSRHSMYDIKEALFLFFDYKSLAAWREQVDEIVSHASFSINGYHNEALEDSLIIYHYIRTLVSTLNQVYEDGGVKVEQPDYLISKVEEDEKETRNKGF